MVTKKKRKSTNTAKIEREEKELKAILTGLPSNPIPWGVVIKMVAPIIARLAVRYALKRLKRGMSEERVNKVADLVGDRISEIIDEKPDGPASP